ncbi:MAG TPA: HAD hydrolase family protein [Polyangiaceae bacterium]|nr:HAD hydrolase family protein [Polyangiaceae bacterium]
MDGTLVGAEGRIAPRDAEAIRELQRRSIPVTLCTGRMYSGTSAVADLLSLREPVACVEGSQIVEHPTGRHLWSAPLPSSHVAPLFEALNEHGPAAFVFARDRVFFDGDGAHYLHYVTGWSQQAERIDAVVDVQQWEGDVTTLALVALGQQVQIEAVHGVIQREHREHLQSACFPLARATMDGVWGLLVRSARVDKGTALEWLAGHYGVTTDELVAVGDWLNDVPMLERAGRSFAMNQAPEVVKSAADEVLVADIWTGGGIAEAAERAGLL